MKRLADLPPNGSTVVRFSSQKSPTHRSLKEELAECGIQSENMQRAFLSLQVTTREPLLALSFLDMSDENRRRQLGAKFDDMVGGVTTVRAQKSVSVLLPVSLAVRYHSITEPQTHLQKYAEMLGIDSPEALYPLLQGQPATIKNDGVDLTFLPWERCLTPPLKACMDTIKDELLGLFKQQYSTEGEDKTVSFLKEQGKAIKQLIKEKLSAADIDIAPFTDETFDTVLHAVIYRSLATVAKGVTNLGRSYSALCQNHGDTLAKEGSEILHGLHQTHSNTFLNTFCDKLMYRLEETIAMKSFFTNQNNILFYIGDAVVKDTEPLSVEATALQQGSLPNLETGNDYVPKDKRKPKTGTQPIPISHKNTGEDLAYLLGRGLIALSRVNHGVVNDNDLEDLVEGLQSGNARRHRNHSQGSSSRGSSSDGEESTSHSPTDRGRSTTKKAHHH